MRQPSRVRWRDVSQLETYQPSPVSMSESKTTAATRRIIRVGKTNPEPAVSRNAEELMELAVEAAQSQDLPAFLEQFAQRSARMLIAVWGGVAVYRGRETELYAMPGSNAATLQVAADWVISNARSSRGDVETRAVPKEIATALQLAVEPEAVVFIRIAASSKEKLGTLCLFRTKKSLGTDEKRLLRALASHAALSLENFRRFSQLERS
jgi:GAF domain-containing protein